jgi:Cys-tRNA(Pro)/Cys-tRNA(Cys) deacylase
VDRLLDRKELHLSEITPVTLALDDKGISYRLFHHPGQVHSLEQAAEERGQRPGQVVRSLLFRLARDEFVMVLVAGPAQVSWPALRKHLDQSRLTTAAEEEVLSVTGYSRGAVSPLGLPAPVRILVDRSVLDEEEISIGSGVRNLTVILGRADLLEAIGPVEIGNFTASGSTHSREDDPIASI